MAKIQYVENELFYHIQREKNGLDVPLWNVGETHFIGLRKNRFFQVFECVDAPFDPTNMTSVNEALDHSVKLIRELIFEEVRKEFFPECPSRQRCLWLVKADNLASLDYWKNELKTGRLLKLQVTGKIHSANQEYLNLTTESVNKIRQKAFYYWTGACGARPEEKEVLFEGFATVVEVIE